MNLLQRITIWLDVRPHEVRNVTLSFLGAFLVIAFATLARSLREALYLTAFDVKTLPYITAAMAVLSVPTVGIFARLLTRYRPRQVLESLLLLLAAGLAVLWIVGVQPGLATYSDVAIVAFYLWTALGTMLIASGFWIVTSEYFAIRGAKRLFGLIGAGGTAGAMVMGNLLIWLTRVVDFGWLVIGLIALLSLFLITERLLPEFGASAMSADESKWKSPMRDSLTAAWSSPHLRTVALIVFAVGITTTLLDYQFKELASAHFTTGEELASFFGGFYGWTGAVAFLIQLVIAARFLSLAGVAWGLAALPLMLLLGSVGLLIVPSLILVTLVRGADTSLRKSVYRSIHEVLYVPVPSLLRRKTKTFIDTVVDSVAEGLGAAIVFLWVTLPGLPSRYLSVFMAALAIWLLFLSRRMGRQYFSTVTAGLKEGELTPERLAVGARLEGRDLLSGTFTHLDLKSLIDEVAVPATAVQKEPQAPAATANAAGEASIADRLRSPDLRTVARALEETVEWDESHIPALVRLLARDPLLDRVVFALRAAGDAAIPRLIALLEDQDTDFIIRRRIPRVLARMGGVEADEALLRALSANRFEVRYRAAIALVRRRRHGLPLLRRGAEDIIWEAIRAEVSRGGPVWELQRLLDTADPEEDDLVSRKVGVRGELSLEHTFRLLTLVLEPKVVQAAFHGVMLGDEKLKSFSLEFLEQVLPADIRDKLWPFIGDVSEYQRERSLRPLDDVVSDLMETGATLFADVKDRAALKRMLEEKDE